MRATTLPCQRDRFAIPEDVAYLNCAYMSPLLESVREVGEAAVGLKSTPWVLGPEHWFGQVEAARDRFARVIGAGADDVALIPSVSYGIGTAVANVPVAAGQRVVLLAEQFPSCVYPWVRRVRETGAVLRTVPRPADGAWTAAILAALDERCAAVTLPACHWTDGGRIDLVAVGARAREVGAQLVLDLSQSVGADPFDVASVDPDWLVAPTYKWLLGPYTGGFLYAAPRNQQGRPLEENWMAREGSEDFSALVDYGDAYRDGARRYDMGERSNFIQLPMVIEALDQLLAWEIPRVAATLAGHNARLAEIAAGHGFRSLPAEERAPHILGLEREGGLPEDLIERLGAEALYVGRRGNSLRVAPHLHVNEADLERFDGALGRVLGPVRPSR